MNLKEYQDRFNRALPEFIENLGNPSPLKDACRYALGSYGKRLRPAIVMMTADALGSHDVMEAAFSVECFHTASLIADDLPCMDDDAMRRGEPSLHKAFGEATAILASYTLIAAGYGAIFQSGQALKKIPSLADSSDARAMACLGMASRVAGLHGATEGQFFDLFPGEITLEMVQNVIYKKTVTLFEISFVFGWIFGGGDLAAIPLLQSAAFHLGMAFQIADDLEDTIQDASQERGVNIVDCLGKEKAISSLQEEIASLEKELRNLSLWTASFQELHSRFSQIIPKLLRPLQPLS